MRRRNCSAPLQNLSLFPLHTCKQQALTVRLWPWGSHSFLLEPAVSSNVCMLHLPKENYTFFFSLGFTEVFLFGKHLLVPFGCCDRFHSKRLTMKAEPLQTPRLLQGPLCCQPKENTKGGGRGAKCAPGVRTHKGPLLSTFIEKQLVGGEAA